MAKLNKRELIPKGRNINPSGADVALTSSVEKVELLNVVPHATDARVVPAKIRLDDPRLYFNRELSWLDFNWRVLYQSRDERVPVLERVRFLAITANNLDEFFRKRIGGLKRQVAADVHIPSPDGRSPAEQLSRARIAILEMYKALNDVWEDQLKPALTEKVGLHILTYAELTESEKQFLHDYFMAELFPILTPLAVDPGHPFPFISNLSLSLAVTLRHSKRETEHFARIKVPISSKRWIRLPNANGFVAVDQVIAHNAHELFRGMDVMGVFAFRITRNADLKRDEEIADDLIEMISDELKERRFAPIVRLEVQQTMPREVRELLMRELNLRQEDVYEASSDLDLVSISQFANMDFPAFQFQPWEPIIPARLLYDKDSEDHSSIFDVIRAGDLMVHHPYESFAASTQRFIEDAAYDRDVIAIKQTLYRTSDESPVVKALLKAAEKGKQVAVLIEVKARFDEKNNMEWGAKLEQHGVHVTYGLVGLKTHSKTTLVIRQEKDGLRAYCHIGTGNYHPSTAKLYTDIGLLTCDPDIGHDVVNLFHYLTGYAPEQRYRKLMIAPRDMRRSFIALIQQEIKNQQEHGNGRIIAKMNALDDLPIIMELYRASEAGVKIELQVRGHCRLRPGLKRVSENITVISVIGRFLEHSRIYYFGNNNVPRVFIGSADWQRRNLEDRVEVVVEINDTILKGRLIRTLQFSSEDVSSAWELHSDGTYFLRSIPGKTEIHGVQQILMERALQRAAVAGQPWDIG